MARSQTWTRNVSKKQKKARPPDAKNAGRGIVGDGALEGLKRRAEELGLILHNQPGKAGEKKDEK